MAEALHRAIRDALRDSPGYAEKGILVTASLEATRPLDADGSLLYRAVYTIFRALPDRLLPGTTLNVETADVDDGVELVWEAREVAGEARAERGRDVRAALARGPNGDLVEVALLALETFCHVRAGHVVSRRQAVVTSSSFERPPYVLRRVLAHIPSARSRGAASPESGSVSS